MNFLYEIKASQDVGDVVQAPDLGCNNTELIDVVLATISSKVLFKGQSHLAIDSNSNKLTTYRT